MLHHKYSISFSKAAFLTAKEKKMNKYLRVILVVGILVLFCQVSNSGHKVFQFALDFHTTIILKNFVKTKKPSTNDNFLIYIFLSL